jgi:hypothetical protein
MEEDSHAEFLKGLVDQALEALSEHFDALQIVGTFMDDNNQTHLVTLGTGNWYARIGAVQEFLTKDEAATTAHEIGKILPESESGFD